MTPLPVCTAIGISDPDPSPDSVHPARAEGLRRGAQPVRNTDRVSNDGRGRRARRPIGSALLHGISRLVSRPLLAVVVVAADIVWVVYK